MIKITNNEKNKRKQYNFYKSNNIRIFKTRKQRRNQIIGVFC